MYKFPRITFDEAAMKLTRIYENPLLKDFHLSPLYSEKLQAVYGPLNFPELPLARPYLYGSFVKSIDGCITFPDAPEGPLVAQKNSFDPVGGLTDFWMLNVLRAGCDGIIFGAAGLNKAETTATATETMFGVDLEGGGHIYDLDLENDRLKMNLPQVPTGIIVSLDCSEVPFTHSVLKNNPATPVILTTSPAGLALVQERCMGKYYVITEDTEDISGEGMPVIITGKGSFPDAKKTMLILKKLGMHRILVETPGYCHHLLHEGLLDELFLNTSGLYIGGNGLSIGGKGKACSSDEHPHAAMLSIHTHSPHFFYYRYQMQY
ncbi:MAG: dihydrofolate reductase family protein [Clostridia bacterium]